MSDPRLDSLCAAMELIAHALVDQTDAIHESMRALRDDITAAPLVETNALLLRIAEALDSIAARPLP